MKKVIACLLGVMLAACLLAGSAAASEAKKYKVAFLPTDMSMTFASWPVFQKAASDIYFF